MAGSSDNEHTLNFLGRPFKASFHPENESFTEYMVRWGCQPGSRWAGNRLFPTLNFSLNQLTKIGIHMVIEKKLVHYPRIYSPESLAALNQQGMSIKKLAEESIDNITVALNTAKYSIEEARAEVPHFNAETSRVQYRMLLASEIHYEINTRESKVGTIPNMLLQFRKKNYFVMNIDPSGNYDKSIPVEGKVLEDLLEDEGLPIMNLSNVSDHLENEHVLIAAARGYADFRHLYATNPDSE